MTTPAVGERAPQVTLTGPEGAVPLTSLLSDGPTVLLFFQEASTPTCESQLRGFCTDYDLVQELGARVLAVSTDPPEAQRRFAERLTAPFPILSDAEGAAARAFGVYDEATRRANRAAFVLDAAGVIRLALPWYNPQNSAQFEQIFTALS